MQSVPGRSDELGDLKRRVSDLEEKQLESTHTVRAFLKDNLTFGGYFESAVTEINGPGTDFQVANATNTLGLNLAGEFTDNLRFAAQSLFILAFNLLNPDNAPQLTTLGYPARRKFSTILPFAILTQAYLEYSPSDIFHIQGGEGYVPFGIALQQRELVLFIRRGGPQLIRIPGLASPLWNGVNIAGSAPTSSSRIGYNLYSFNNLTDTRIIGVGSRAWWQSPAEAVTVGVSSQTGRQNNLNIETLGADLRLKTGRLSMNTEYARSFGYNDNPWTAYIEPAVNVYGDSWLVYTFVDYANNSQNSTTVGTVTVADPYHRLEYGGGVNWLPTSFTRLRFGVYYLDYMDATTIAGAPERDFLATDISVAVAF
jgi:hypothetical protein